MDADSPSERFYAGEFRHSIDDKNRITIPSRWRRDRPEEFILLPEATHQFLLVMSPKEFAKMSSAAETNQNVSARDRRVFLRQLHSRAQHAGADRQGRAGGGDVCDREPGDRGGLAWEAGSGDGVSGGDGVGLGAVLSEEVREEGQTVGKPAQ